MSESLNETTGVVKDRLESFGKRLGFQDPLVLTTSGSKTGDNYVGSISRLTIKERNSLSTNDLSVVLKEAPKDAATRTAMPLRDFYMREIYAYEVVLPALQEVKVDGFRSAGCLLCSDEECAEVLLLEDLAPEGFTMHRPRLATLDRAHLAVALTQLARFHALSFALQSQNPDRYEQLAKNMEEVVFTSEKYHRYFETYMEKCTKKVVETLRGEQVYEKVENFLKDTFTQVVDLIKPQRYSVFCHGDYWKNNILFKYEDGMPVAACALDYQLMRVSSPCTDVAFLVMCCSSQATRRSHLDELLNVYHAALDDQLSRCGLSAHDVFPRDAFLQEMRRVGALGLGMAVCVLTLIICSDDSVPDLLENVTFSATTHENPDTIQLYKERILEIAEDCVKYEYIK